MILDITGTLLIVFYKNNQPVNKKEEKEITEKFQKGDLFLGLESKKIFDDKLKVLYTFEFEVEENTEYDFYDD